MGGSMTSFIHMLNPREHDKLNMFKINSTENK